ncbi:hypothetical protein [Pseudomonas sp. PLMAX]|uniref:hypothetical protein n=1 Tax=Pseudomonas sp. PLMAX TaxID=2201998 RepID=UPI0038BAE886
MNLYENIPNEDITIVAELFRMARSGRYKKLKVMLADAPNFIPDTSDEQLQRCAKHLGNILFDSNHGGYGDELLRSNQRKHLRAAR